MLMRENPAGGHAPVGLVAATIFCCLFFLAMLITTFAWLVPQIVKSNECSKNHDADPSTDCTDFIFLRFAAIPMFLVLGIALISACVGAIAIAWHVKR